MAQGSRVEVVQTTPVIPQTVPGRAESLLGSGDWSPGGSQLVWHLSPQSPAHSAETRGSSRQCQSPRAPFKTLSLADTHASMLASFCKGETEAGMGKGLPEELTTKPCYLHSHMPVSSETPATPASGHRSHSTAPTGARDVPGSGGGSGPGP